MIEEIINKIEQLVDVPNVDLDGKGALRGMKMLNLITQLRTEVKNLNIPAVSNRRELLIAYNKHILDRLTEYEGEEICDNMVDDFIGNL